MVFCVVYTYIHTHIHTKKESNAIIKKQLLALNMSNSSLRNMDLRKFFSVKTPDREVSSGEQSDVEKQVENSSLVPDNPALPPPDNPALPPPDNPALPPPDNPAFLPAKRIRLLQSEKKKSYKAKLS